MNKVLFTALERIDIVKCSDFKGYSIKKYNNHIQIWINNFNIFLYLRKGG